MLPLLVCALLSPLPRLAEVLPVPDEQGTGSHASSAPNPPLKADTDAAKKDESELAAVPAVFRTPETGLGGGGALIYIPASHGGRVSSALGGLLYTQKKQFLTALYWENYFAHDTWVSEIFTSFQHYPDSFFGVGADTNAADEETYIWEQKRIATTLRYLITPDLRFGPSAVRSDDEFSELKEGGQLASGDIDGVKGGKSIGLGISGRYDTLDDGYGPTKGQVVNITSTRYLPALGSDFSFSTTEINVKGFTALSAGDVIGAQLFTNIEGGNPPFYQLAPLGGKNLLRGYFLGRYRDRNLVVAQTEWRHHIAGSFGGVFFAGVGDVAHDLKGFKAKDLKPSGGIGARYQLVQKQKINLRVDIGVGRSQPGPALYLYLLEAF